MSRPLAGKTVVVTRARTQAAGLSHRLRDLGARVLECPLIRVKAAPEIELLDREIDRLESFDWIVFTSANAVDFFTARLRERKLLPLLVAGRPAVAAVGKGTSSSLDQRGIVCALVAPEAVAESLAAALISRGIAGQSVLFPKARAARETLPSALLAAGAHVQSVTVYDTLPDDEGARPLSDALAAAEVDAVVFASGSAVDRFRAVAGPPDSVSFRIVSIGPVTTARAEELGYRVSATATEHNDAGLVRAVLSVLGG